MHFRKRMLVWFVVIGNVLVLSGCDEGRKLQVQNKIEEFHEAYNKNKSNDVYDLFTKKLKSEITEDQTLQLFNKEKNEAGEYLSATLTDYKETTYINKEGADIVLTYRSSFSKANVEEIFHFTYEGLEPKLSGYRYTAFEKGISDAQKMTKKTSAE